MSSFTVSVSIDGEESILPVKPRSVVAFERNFKMGLAKAFNTDQKMEHVYWLGWEAMRASGHVVKPFDAWLETVDEVSLVPKEDERAT